MDLWIIVLAAAGIALGIYLVLRPGDIAAAHRESGRRTREGLGMGARAPESARTVRGIGIVMVAAGVVALALPLTGVI